MACLPYLKHNFACFINLNYNTQYKYEKYMKFMRTLNCPAGPKPAQI